MSNIKVAFLYTEVAGYFLACAKELALRADVLIFRWPVNKEAPFDIEGISGLTIKDRTNYNQEQLDEELKKFNPDIIVCSGWIDKGYISAVKKFKKKIPTVLTLDNHWTGSLKQRLAVVLSPFYLQRIFTNAWVPGGPQAVFAKKLGFSKNLLENFYCADTDLFSAEYKKTFPSKKEKFPKRFLFVARYVEHKGIFEMWEAFSQLQKENPNDWELWCLGTGEEWENRVEGEKIKHIGFVQPTDLTEYIEQTGVYILPSKFEPWGVTVQEFAACGFPLLVSNEIGARTTYLKNNGFEFSAGSVEEIKKAMKKIINLTEEELITMGEDSHQLGMSFTPTKWCDNLLSIIKDGKISD